MRLNALASARKPHSRVQSGSDCICESDCICLFRTTKFLDTFFFVVLPPLPTAPAPRLSREIRPVRARPCDRGSPEDRGCLQFHRKKHNIFLFFPKLTWPPIVSLLPLYSLESLPAFDPRPSLIEKEKKIESVPTTPTVFKWSISPPWPPVLPSAPPVPSLQGIPWALSSQAGPGTETQSLFPLRNLQKGKISFVLARTGVIYYKTSNGITVIHYKPCSGKSITFQCNVMAKYCGSWQITWADKTNFFKRFQKSKK